MKRIIAILLACVMMIACFAACGGNTDTSAPADNSGDTAAPAADTADTAAGSKVLRTALSADIVTMDCQGTTNDYLVPMNIYDRLFNAYMDDNGNVVEENSLCDSYELSEDGLTYTFHLVEGVEFSNGEPFTAEDVIFTFEHLLDPISVNADIPLEVVGAQEFMDGEAETIEGMVAEDEYTVVVTLSAPNPGFVTELTSAQMGMLDKTTTEAASNFGINVEETIGCGPYIVTEWVNNDHITLVRNDNYWGELPDVEECIISIIPDASTQNLMYQNGELDLVDLDYIDASIVSATYLTQYADNIITRQRAALAYLALNENNEYLSDINVRKAIQMAIDRETIVDRVFNGMAQISNSIIPSGVVGHSDSGSTLTYDPEAAKALLEEAGYSENEITFELSFNTGRSDTRLKVYQIIQQQLQAVGIKTEITNRDENSWTEFRKTGEMDAFMDQWTMDFNDPANILVTFFGSESNAKGRSLNYTNTEVMDRVAAASSIIDDAERYAEYNALEEIIVYEDAAWVPLYQETHLFAVSDNVESFEPHWAGYGDFYIADVVMK